MIDMRDLFNISPSEFMSRIIHSFLPGAHASILSHPDLYGPFIAVCLFPQVYIICHCFLKTECKDEINPLYAPFLVCLATNGCNRTWLPCDICFRKLNDCGFVSLVWSFVALQVCYTLIMLFCCIMTFL